MGLFTDLPYRQIFKVCRRLWPGESTPHLSSLYQARQRLGVVPFRGRLLPQGESNLVVLGLV